MTMQQRIESTLALLQPEHLQVLDESHMHSRGLQTHFKAVVVSQQFEGLNRVKRCLLYTSPSPRDRQKSRMPSSA